MHVLIAINSVLAVALLALLVAAVVNSFRRLRGVRLVDCPDTPWPTLVVLDAKRGALSAVTGVGRLRVRDCARWPAHRDCGQACLRHITPAMAETEEMLCQGSVSEPD